MSNFTENEIEEIALELLAGLGYSIKHGPDIAPDGLDSERTNYSKVILEERLRNALARLNPDLPPEALDDAFRRLRLPDGAELILQNRSLHQMLTDGVTVEYQDSEGVVRGAQVSVFDYECVEANDWLVVNQFSVTENRRTRRPDIVFFINGLPVVVLELKSATDKNATIRSAYQQLQTYQAEIPSLFVSNALLIVSDGVEARGGATGAAWEWFKPWRTIAGDELADSHLPELRVMLEGLCEKQHLLALIRDFIVFEDNGRRVTKKVAGYHQFHAVQTAVDETLRAAKLRRLANEQDASESGQRLEDRRIGVVWHTQGAGKSLTMAFYAGRVIREPRMENPTIVVLTDRNDLDDQLFGVFCRCADLFRQPPVQAQSRASLRNLLTVESGSVIFTTIHKFFPDEKGDQHPELSKRQNIVVIADEAHRSQYDFIDGYARHMRDALPRASFIGFTGTPIELRDVNTRAVFGDYISIYDIQRAVQDGATVPIYYESRLAKITLDDADRPKINTEFEEATEGEEVERKEKLKSKWARLETIVGSDKRVGLVAQDIVEHFEKRLESMDGKGMIACMSRRIAVDLYRSITDLRSNWHSSSDELGRIKVVMTGSVSDPPDWQAHIRNKPRREALANRFRDPKDPFCLVIVRDMWLTGFDAPSLHTMYIDKPMHDHGLMQAIARVNRVFRDKPGGLVVDYLGLAQELKQAMAVYTENGGRGCPTLDQEEAVRLMLEKYEVCRNFFHGLDWSKWTTGSPQERLSLLPLAQEHTLAQQNGKVRIISIVSELSRAFALAVPHPEALRIRDDVSFFQSVQNVLAKRAPSDSQSDEELDRTIKQIISRAMTSVGVVDIYAASGIKKPDISILSENFLAEIQDMPQRNLAVELLQKLLKGEIKTRSKKNVVQARSFAEMLEQSLQRYQSRAIEAAEVIKELIDLAREMREVATRGKKLNLSEDELAFYDALETNDSAVKILGDETLRGIARELVKTVRNNVTIDWTLRENIRAHLRVTVKRVLRKHGYPPDKEEKAARTILEQAELFGASAFRMDDYLG